MSEKNAMIYFESLRESRTSLCSEHPSQRALARQECRVPLSVTAQKRKRTLNARSDQIL